MSDDNQTDDDQNFKQRLNDALKRNNLDLTGDEPIKVNETESDFGAASNGLAQGMRLGLEFLSGTIVGLLIGLGLDKYFDTSPWCLLVFSLLGFAAGMLNVYRDINQIQESIGVNKRNVLTERVKSPIQQSTD